MPSTASDSREMLLARKAYPLLAARKLAELQGVALDAAVYAFRLGLSRDKGRAYLRQLFAAQMQRLLPNATEQEERECLNVLHDCSTAFLNGCLDGLVTGKSQQEVLDNALFLRATLYVNGHDLDSAIENIVRVVAWAITSVLLTAVLLPGAVARALRGTSPVALLRAPRRGPGYWLFRFRGIDCTDTGGGRARVIPLRPR